MATWPIDVPAWDGRVIETRQDGFIRTEVSQGPSKQRRRYSAVSSFLSGQMTFNANEYAAFQAFYNTEIDGGAGEFDMLDPVTGANSRFRFVVSPEVRHLTGRSNRTTLYRMNIQLERLP